jgi:GNAT superfamily N-acetyltransferase
MQHDDCHDRISPRVLTLRNGRTVLVREIRPEDEGMLDDAFARLCKEARYSRFFHVVRSVPVDILRPRAAGPRGHAVALVALSGQGSASSMVGGARYVTDSAGEACEFAITVADDWHRMGLARQLMCLLMDIARVRHVRRMEGTVLATNAGMRALAFQLGFRDLPVPDDYSLRSVIRDL